MREHGADLALVFDGDADRCFIIDERGEVVSPSAVTAHDRQSGAGRGSRGRPIVVNKITSRSVAEVVAERGRADVVTRVGHTFVKAAMAEHDAIFGGEHSAHYYFRDFWGADTGMLAALHVLAAGRRAPTGRCRTLVARVHPLRRLRGDQLDRGRRRGDRWTRWRRPSRAAATPTGWTG